MTKQELISFEDGIKLLWEKGKINAPIHLSGGNEEELLWIFKSIKKGDYVFSTWRNHYHYLLHTGNWDKLFKSIVNKDNELRSMHTIDRENNFFSSAIVGGCCSIATGVGLALKLKNSPKKVWCFIGDGAVDSGWFWESFRYVIGHDLPVTFIIEDNNRSVDTNIRERWGKNDNVMDNIAHTKYTGKIIYYIYIPKYPHVGSGKYVAF